MGEKWYWELRRNISFISPVTFISPNSRLKRTPLMKNRQASANTANAS
jgi:hypothetical protein